MRVSPERLMMWKAGGVMPAPSPCGACAGAPDPRSRCPRCRSPGMPGAVERGKHAILPVCGPESRAGPVPRTFRPGRCRSARRRRWRRSPPASMRRSAPIVWARRRARAERRGVEPAGARSLRQRRGVGRIRAPPPTARAPSAPVSASARAASTSRGGEYPVRRELAPGTGKCRGCMLSGNPEAFAPAPQLDQPVRLALRRALAERQPAGRREDASEVDRLDVDRERRASRAMATNRVVPEVGPRRYRREVVVDDACAWTRLRRWRAGQTSNVVVELFRHRDVAAGARNAAGRRWNGGGASPCISGAR